MQKLWAPPMVSIDLEYWAMPIMLKNKIFLDKKKKKNDNVYKSKKAPLREGPNSFVLYMNLT